MAHDTDTDTNSETVDAVLIDYDPPPVPPGVSVDTAYLGLVYASGTRAVLRDAHRRHGELKGLLLSGGGHVHRRSNDGPGLQSWMAKRLGLLPNGIQTGLVLTGCWLGLQLAGALYERLVGHPPPQVTVPTIVTQPIPGMNTATTSAPDPAIGGEH